MVNSLQYKESIAAIYFALTAILVNIIFYASLKLTTPSIAQVNIEAGIFNIFLNMFLISIIKIIKRSPKVVAFDREMYEKMIEQFYDQKINQEFELTKDENDLFDEFLKTKRLKFCRKCLVFKVK